MQKEISIEEIKDEVTLYHIELREIKNGYKSIVNVKTIAENNKRTFEDFQILDSINVKKYKGYEDDVNRRFLDSDGSSEESCEYSTDSDSENENENEAKKEISKEDDVAKKIDTENIEVLKHLVSDNITEEGVKWKFANLMLKKMCDPSVIMSQLTTLVTVKDENINYDIIMSMMNALLEMKMMNDHTHVYLKNLFHEKNNIVDVIDNYLLFELTNNYIYKGNQVLKRFFMSAFLKKTIFVKTFIDEFRAENNIKCMMVSGSSLHKLFLVFLKQLKYLYKDYVEMDQRVTVFYLMISLYRENIDIISMSKMENEFYILIKIITLDPNMIERYYKHPLMFGADMNNYGKIFETFIVHMRNNVIPDKLVFEKFIIPDEIKSETDFDIRREKIYKHVKSLGKLE